MPRPLCALAPLVLALAVCAAPLRAQTSPVVFTPFVSGLTSPVGFVPVPDDATRFLVVQQNGQLREVVAGVLTAAPALNVTTRISTGGERGLLGLAFHPAWPDSAYVYTDFTRTGDGATVIARYARTGTGPGVAFSLASERVVLVVPQPFANHNAGDIAFGPDGFLYVTLGDGGSGGDPNGSGQNRNDLLGSILRIDVDRHVGLGPDCGNATGGPAPGYTIPPDNPFVGVTAFAACDEIYAYGLRNPWRMTFDQATGTLWTGDVGQGAWEEIDTVAVGRNYGWNIMEGFHCYSPSSGCNQTGLTLPVFEYNHSGRCSITGGYVYRGTNIPALVGKYLYADYCSDEVWSLDVSGAAPVSTLLGIRTNPTSFGQGLDGEMYVMGSGVVYRIDRNTVSTEADAEMAGLAFTLAGPSPARARTAFTFTAPTAGPARLVLLDALGREVARLFDGTVMAGASTRAEANVAGLAPGVYLARLTTGDGARTLRLTVAR